MSRLKFTVLLPTYNSSESIRETLKSIQDQTYQNFEILVQDDASTDATESIIMSLHYDKIKYYKNSRNLGYSHNLESLRKKASGDILFLIGQDDILAKDAFLNTKNAFDLSEDIGAVTRPYYWFDDDIHKPVRIKNQLNPQKDEVVDLQSDIKKIITLFSTLDQLSGLALRRKYIDLPFHEDIFPSHVYPFASIFKKHPVVFLKNYNTAVRIRTSQSRLVSSIYTKSPLKSWVDLFTTVFDGDEYTEFRDAMIKNFVATNYIGLVQIKNYSTYTHLLREIYYLLKYRWQNFFNPFFWFFSIGSIITPSGILIPMVDWYKNKLNFKRFGNIKL